MSRYNHFTPRKFQTIDFKDVKVGEKFRMDKHKGKIARRDIVMVKTGDLSYRELISKREYTLFSGILKVSHYKNLEEPF